MWGPQKRGFRTRVICLPRSQLWSRNGPFPIGAPVLGINDLVAPDLCEVLAPERVPRHHPIEEGAPIGRTRAEDDSHGLRPDRPDGTSEPMRALELGWEALHDRVVGEDEVPRRDGNAVAPARSGVDSNVTVNGGLFVSVALDTSRGR